MSNFTLIKEEEVFGENRSEIFKKYGTKASISDFSILLGGYVASGCYVKEQECYKNRTSLWWTQNSASKSSARIVDCFGLPTRRIVDKNFCGIRLAVPYSEIKNSVNNTKEINGIKETEYGEYPQTVVSFGIAKKIEVAYKNDLLEKTGKYYTIDDSKNSESTISFESQKIEEYIYEGKGYIRMIGNDNNFCKTLSSGGYIQYGSPVWIMVEPLKWLVDEKSNIAITKDIIFSGIQYDTLDNYNGKFEDTHIKKFIDNYLAKEIIADKKHFYKENNETKLNFSVDFTKFCNKPVISIENVINGNYSDEIFEQNIAEKIATITSLVQVDEQNVKTIRDFVARLDNEVLPIFDAMWIGNNEQRLAQISELKKEKNRSRIKPE